MFKIQDNLREKKIKEIRSDYIFTLVVNLIILCLTAVLFVNTYVFMNVRVEGSSMYPTLKSGDVLIANKLKTVERGDIVIIKDEKPDEWLIKRVIAMEGDTVEIKAGSVFVNGKKLNEPYIIHPNMAITEAGDWQKRTLKKGEIFYLGDNRTPNASLDSRSYLSTCSKDQIVGVVEEWSLSLRPVLNVLSKIVEKTNQKVSQS